jgi:hypothetical protein
MGKSLREIGTSGNLDIGKSGVAEHRGFTGCEKRPSKRAGLQPNVTYIKI